MDKKIRIYSDFEGILAVNDNAAEVAAHVIPNGHIIFPIVSAYDDYLADVIKRAGYRAGTTLMFMAPFLKAYGLTDQDFTGFCQNHMSWIRGAQQTMRFLQRAGLFPVDFVSTSYQPFIAVGARLLGITGQHVHSTPLSLDQIPISDQEAENLRRLAKYIATLPMIDLPKGAQSRSDLTPKTCQTIDQCEEIFGKIIPGMKVGQAAQKKVIPMGGKGKASAIQQSAQGEGVDLGNVFYPGDSITDVDAFQLLRKTGGLSLAFNGNRFATSEAEFVLTADSTWPIALVALAFRWGRRKGMELLAEWGEQPFLDKLEAESFDPNLLAELELGLEETEWYLFDSANRDTDMAEANEKSSAMREKVRGKANAALG